MNQLVQVLSNSLTFGSLYSLVALSLVLVFRSSGVLNFGVGYLATFSGIFFSNFGQGGGIKSLALAFLISGCLGSVCYLVAVRPADARGAHHSTLAISSLGFGIVVEYFGGHFWAQQGYSPTPLVAGGISIADSYISSMRILVVLLSVAAYLLVHLVIEKTMFGWSMESIAYRKTTAALYGVNITVTLVCVWFISGVLAGLAGTMIAPITQVSLPISLTLAIKGFTACVLGGMTSIRGVLFASLLIATFESLMILYVSSTYANATVFLVLFASLVLKPNGIFTSSNATGRV